jgi:hypothetical protein
VKISERIGGLTTKGAHRMWCSDGETNMDTSLSYRNMEGEGGEASLSSHRVETGRDGGIAGFRCSG